MALKIVSPKAKSRIGIIALSGTTRLYVPAPTGDENSA